MEDQASREAPGSSRARSVTRRATSAAPDGTLALPEGRAVRLVMEAGAKTRMDRAVAVLSVSYHQRETSRAYTYFISIVDGSKFGATGKGSSGGDFDDDSSGNQCESPGEARFLSCPHLFGISRWWR